MARDLVSGEGGNDGKSHHRRGESAEKGADSAGAARLGRARGQRLNRGLRRRCGPEFHFGLPQSRDEKNARDVSNFRSTPRGLQWYGGTSAYQTPAKLFIFMTMEWLLIRAKKLGVYLGTGGDSGCRLLRNPYRPDVYAVAALQCCSG